MGDATKLGADSLAEIKAGQAAYLVVKNPYNDKYFTGKAEYGDSGGRHVEAILLQDVLTAEYGGEYKKIPNNATIIIAGKWSPCRRCVDDQYNTGKCSCINYFIRYSRLFERGVKLKLRFLEYYTAKAWAQAGYTVGNSDLMWNSPGEADKYYEELSKSYHDAKLVKRTVDLGKFVLEVHKLSRHLVISRYEEGVKTSRVIIPGVDDL